MMAEFYELLKLIEATSWDASKGTYASIMHAIEEGELSWQDRATLMQCRMTHTHAAVFCGAQTMHRPGNHRTQSAAVDKKLVCKFHCAGNCREGAESHTDPLTGITYMHEGEEENRILWTTVAASLTGSCQRQQIWKRTRTWH